MREEICNTRVHWDTYADKVRLKGAQEGGDHRTGATVARLDIHESKSDPWRSPASGGLAGGESTDCGGEGYEACTPPSLGETGTEGGWTLMWRL